MSSTKIRVRASANARRFNAWSTTAGLEASLGTMSIAGKYTVISILKYHMIINVFFKFLRCDPVKYTISAKEIKIDKAK
jgi:hypothetical protein